MSMHDIFEFQKTGLDDDRKMQGFFCSTGLRPNLLPRLATSGVGMSPELFERRVLKNEQS